MIKTMGKRLMAVREHLGIFQAKMAEELCVSRAHLYRLERGETPPNAMVLKNLSAVFDVSMDWFFTGKGVMIRSLAKQKYQEWDFGKDEKFVQHLLEKMYKIPPLRYAVLTYFDEYYADNKDFFDKVLEQYERFHEKYKPDTDRQPEPKAVLNVIKEPDLEG
jgi:transcriptional regulator with XRE-family HTH domain